MPDEHREEQKQAQEHPPQLDLDMQIAFGIVRVSELEDLKLAPEKMAAIIQLGAQMRGYRKEFNNNPLIPTICEKKIEFILQAKSKADLKEILDKPKIHYNYNEIVGQGKYHVEEEELLLWCLTSLWCGRPLPDYAAKRYMMLAKKFIPDYDKVIGYE